MRCIVTVFFSAQVNVATLAQHEQGQGGKHQKSYNNFPHTLVLKKKTPEHHGPGVVNSLGS